MGQLANDPKHFGLRVDTGELASYRRRAPTIIGLVEHGPNGFAQRLWRWLVARKIDPDTGPCDTRIDVGLVFGQPRGDKGNSEAHGLVDAAITAVGDEHVDLGQDPFEGKILEKARIARDWSRDGVDGAPACGGDNEQIGLVPKRLYRRAAPKAQIVICHRFLRHQKHLARVVELIGPGWQRSLTRNDRRRADKMYRGRNGARKLEAWNRQLQISIGKLDDGIEKGRRQRSDAQSCQRSIQAIGPGLLDYSVVFTIHRRVMVALLFRRCRG